ncbi:hypothetical protein ISS37_06705 [candidate division KSB1 bacterium]|nr:hypothetical protein [candidate division KSB1 bacterium]
MNIKEKHHRRSIRLKDYDYSQPGGYFITICLQHRQCLLGEIVKREMKLNAPGRMIEKWWMKIPVKFPGTEIDEHIIMPNHFHGNVMIVGAVPRVCPNNIRICQNDRGEPMCSPLRDNDSKRRGSPLPKIIQWFKTMTTNEYIRMVKNAGWISFQGKLWQRNYYEHVIRNEDELNRIREYIINNPLRWEYDRDNPDGKPEKAENKFWKDFVRGVKIRDH